MAGCKDDFDEACKILRTICVEDNLAQAASMLPTLLAEHGQEKNSVPQKLDGNRTLTVCSFDMANPFMTDGTNLNELDPKSKVTAEEIRNSANYKNLHAAAAREDVALEIVERSKLSNQNPEFHDLTALVVVAVLNKPYHMSSELAHKQKKSTKVTDIVKPPRGLKSGGWPVEEG